MRVYEHFEDLPEKIRKGLVGTKYWTVDDVLDHFGEHFNYNRKWVREVMESVKEDSFKKSMNQVRQYLIDRGATISFKLGYYHRRENF